MKNITDSVFYAGVDDKDIDLFEGQYIVPNGMAYNSYIIMDEKIAIMDMVDKRKAEEWMTNVADILGERQPDYLIISHLEPDHSAFLGDVLAKYPKLPAMRKSSMRKPAKLRLNSSLRKSGPDMLTPPLMPTWPMTLRKIPP